MHSDELVSKYELSTVTCRGKFRSEPVRKDDPIPNCKLYNYVKKDKGLTIINISSAPISKTTTSTIVAYGSTTILLLLLLLLRLCVTWEMSY